MSLYVHRSQIIIIIVILIINFVHNFPPIHVGLTIRWITQNTIKIKGKTKRVKSCGMINLVVVRVKLFIEVI